MTMIIDRIINIIMVDSFINDYIPLCISNLYHLYMYMYVCVLYEFNAIMNMDNIFHSMHSKMPIVRLLCHHSCFYVH